MSYIKQKDTGGDTYNLLANQDGIDVNLNLDAAAGADSQVKLKAGSNITLTEAGTNSISIDANGDTYTLEATQSGSDVEINLDANAGVDSKVTLKAGTNITLTEAADEITIDAAGGGGSPGGANTQVQFNDGGAFGGDADFTFTKTAGAEQVKISASSSTDLVKITQTGGGNAFLVEDSASPDSTPFTIASDGKVGIGIAPGGGFVLRTSSIGNIQAGQNGFMNAGRFTSRSNGSPSSVRFSRDIDMDTGMYFPGTNQVGFSTAGNERLRFGDSGQIGLAGANYGTSGQVLTSGGPGAPVSWQNAGGGGAQFAYTGALNADIYGSNTSLRSVYPLFASGQSALQSQANTWNPSFTTTDINFFPCIMPQTGTLDSISFRTGGSGPGTTLHIALYASDSNGLPNGAPAFTNTIVTPTINTSYSPSISISGITKGDLYYFAVFGQTVKTVMRTIDVSDGGTFSVARGLTAANWSIGSRQQSFELQGQTNGVFPTLSASTQYQVTTETTQILSAGIAFS